MDVGGEPCRTIWRHALTGEVTIIDQTKLPFAFETRVLRTLDDAAEAIRTMRVRGAPLIGATAAYGMYLALTDDPSDDGVGRAYDKLLATRPTAINLKWALDRVAAAVRDVPVAARAAAADRLAVAICDDDVAVCRGIGEYGAELLRSIAARKSGLVNVLTHCNAGWLATVDWGTALAPIYVAAEWGVDVHVWVSETRPRNQGASLTTWELANAGLPYTVVVDNTAGHLMQSGLVDLCLVGTDRTCANGDVCNKIGTYMKALAAHDNDVPFYVALPSSTIDWTLPSGVTVPIEQRDGFEVTHITGRGTDGVVHEVALTPPGSQAANYAFDVTPARYVTGLITERGLTDASSEGLSRLYPEHGRS